MTDRLLLLIKGPKKSNCATTPGLVVSQFELFQMLTRPVDCSLMVAMLGTQYTAGGELGQVVSGVLDGRL